LKNCKERKLSKKVYICYRVWHKLKDWWEIEIKNVRDSEMPGIFLPILKYTFAFFALLSIGAGINRRNRNLTSQEIRDKGLLYIIKRVDWYIFIWLVLELLAVCGIMTSPAFMLNSLYWLIIGFFSYRLFEIFQSWVSQFILTYKWDPINTNRSLVLAFEGYLEITLIGAVIRFTTSSEIPESFSASFSDSVMAMIANPKAETLNAIGYIQIIFSILFVAVVVQQVLARISVNSNNGKNK
jgi:hypothetical protein